MAESRIESFPRIFEYLDYRDFLKDCLESLQASTGMGRVAFLKHLGFKSTSYLSMLLDRRRNLKPATARQIGHRLGLKSIEVDFFQALVHFNDAKESSVRDLAYQKVLKFKKYRDARTTAEAEYEMFRAWYVVAILEAIETPWMRMSLSDKAAAFQIEPEQVKSALALLEKLGLIIKDGTVYRKREKARETPAEIQSLLARNYHREMIRKALDSVDRLPKDERYVEGLTISLSKKHAAEIQARLSAFRKELNTEFSDENDPQSVYQINFQCIPLGQLES